jgi:hypothetical protein
MIFPYLMGKSWQNALLMPSKKESAIPTENVFYINFGR